MTLAGALLLIIPALVTYVGADVSTVSGYFAAAAAGSGPIEWMLGVLIAAAAIVTVFQRKMLSAVVVLGTVGFVGAAVFLLYGAPDVAMTQLAVETLIVIIFVLVIYHMPSFSRLTGPGGRTVDAVIAGALGLTMGTFVLIAAGVDLAATLGPAFAPISEFHAEKSVPKAYGHNVINVILVDFRGFDTLGEIFVLGAAAVGLFTLLRPPSRRLVVKPPPRAGAGEAVEGVTP